MDGIGIAQQSSTMFNVWCGLYRTMCSVRFGLYKAVCSARCIGQTLSEQQRLNEKGLKVGTDQGKNHHHHQDSHRHHIIDIIDN